MPTFHGQGTLPTARAAQIPPAKDGAPTAPLGSLGQASPRSRWRIGFAKPQSGGNFWLFQDCPEFLTHLHRFLEKAQCGGRGDIFSQTS